MLTGISYKLRLSRDLYCLLTHCKNRYDTEDIFFKELKAMTAVLRQREHLWFIKKL